MVIQDEEDVRLLGERVASEADAARERGAFRREFGGQGFVGERSRTVYGGRETENAPRITQGGDL